jgi:hypothetical protein
MNFVRMIAIVLILAIGARPLRADQIQEIFVLAVMFAAWQEDQQEDEDSFMADAGKPAEVATLVKHRIDDEGHCGFFAKRGLRWKKDFADGSTLEVRCHPDPGSILPGYHIWFVAHGKRVEIARCIFDEGINMGWYYTSAGPAGEDCCLARVEWVNVDGGRNDGRKSRTGRRIDKEHFTAPDEPYLDVVKWVFDANRRRVECVSDKFQYVNKPVLPVHLKTSIEAFVGPRVPELRRSFTTELSY